MDTLTPTHYLLNERGTIARDAQPGYTYHNFQVAPDTASLRVRLRYHKDGICQLYMSVFGPNGYRGTRMKPGALGEVELELTFGDEAASLGAIAGAIEPGTWTVLLDLERTRHATEYTLTVEAGNEQLEATEGPAVKGQRFSPSSHNGRGGEGWYRGELHSHTHHSDGKAPVAEVVAAARRYGLDFLALTDHYTTAGWAELQSLSGPDLCLMNGLELTAHAGHANMHGLQGWVNPFVDGPGWDVNDAARAVRQQGGLFCVNHAFALDLGWRYHRFDWRLADLMEIYHHLEGSANTSQLALWDGLLRQGLRITGVAGTDSHDPHAGRHRLGQVFTHVFAPELSQAGILEGLKKGWAYVGLGGAQMEFSATNQGRWAGMGGSLGAGQISLQASLSDLPHPSRVLLMKNGFYHTHTDLPATHSTRLEFQDPDGRPGDFYRLEVFALTPQQAGGNGREWQNTLLLSNPIYLE